MFATRRRSARQAASARRLTHDQQQQGGHQAVQAQAPELVGQAHQLDRGVGAAGAGREHIGQQAVELHAAHDAVGQRHVAGVGGRCHEVLPERCGHATERQQDPQARTQPPPGRTAPGQAQPAGQRHGEEDHPLQHTPGAGLHAKGMLRHQGRPHRGQAEHRHSGQQPGRNRDIHGRLDRVRSGHLGNQLDLDAGAHRDLRHAEGAAGMGAALAEHLAQQLGAAVGHQVLFGVVAGAVDQAHHLDDAGDGVEVAHGRVQGAQQVDGDGAGGELAGGGVGVAAELADPGLAVAFGDVARQEHQLAAANEGHIGRCRDGDRRQADAQLTEAVVNGNSRGGHGVWGPLNGVFAGK